MLFGGRGRGRGRERGWRRKAVSLVLVALPEKAATRSEIKWKSLVLILRAMRIKTRKL